MGKDFTHHDNWFYILDHVWNRQYKEPYPRSDKRVIHCAPNTADYEFLYHYIEKTDKLYRISRGDLVKFRFDYNDKWHVPAQHLEEIPITDKWREEIKGYHRDKPAPMSTNKKVRKAVKFTKQDLCQHVFINSVSDDYIKCQKCNYAKKKETKEEDKEVQ